MFKKIEVSNELNFYENKDLNCYLSHEGSEDDLKVNIGLMVEIMNLVEATGEGDENYPYVVSIGLMASHPDKSFDETEDVNPSQVSLLYDCNAYMGSVPVDHVLTDSINGGIDEVKKLFTIDEAKVVKQKQKFGTIAAQRGSNYEFQYLMFSSEDSAHKFVDYIIETRASALKMLIGFILDKPINLAGDSGWSQIKAMVYGSDFNRRKRA